AAAVKLVVESRARSTGGSRVSVSVRRAVGGGRWAVGARTVGTAAMRGALLPPCLATLGNRGQPDNVSVGSRVVVPPASVSGPHVRRRAPTRRSAPLSCYGSSSHAMAANL